MKYWPPIIYLDDMKSLDLYNMQLSDFLIPLIKDT